MTRRASLALLGAGTAVAVAAVLGVTAAGPESQAEEKPTRILLVGDSVTHGVEGDWTWRYRLWKHLEATDTSVDFVGPHDDVYDIDNGEPTHWYVDPGFDQDHAARRGTMFTSLDPPVGELVDEYDPDVVVVMLGANDVVFSSPPASPEAIDGRLRDFVAAARAADPDVAFVASRIPHGYFEQAAEFNALVPGTASELASDGSPIAVAYPDVGFDLREHTWDNVHPNARGEVLIAAAVADALATLGVGGPAVRPLPVVDVGPRFAPPLTVEAGDRSARLTWFNPPGVLEEIIEMRDVTAGEEWAQRGSAAAGSERTVRGLVNGHTYEFRLRPKRGYAAAPADVRSPTRAVVPGP